MFHRYKNLREKIRGKPLYISQKRKKMEKVNKIFKHYNYNFKSFQCLTNYF